MTWRTRLLLPVVRNGRRAVEQARQRWLRFGELWRRSLQLRVVVSTLALSSAVVFVLGMVLQMQITNQLLETKTNAAIQQTKASAAAVQPDLLGLNPGPDTVRTRFLSAVNKLNTASSGQDVASSGAGAFEPVLDDAGNKGADGQPNSVGPHWEVPEGLAKMVQSGFSGSQITTVEREAGPTTLLVVGVPVSTSARAMQLYLLFPLTSEQATAEVVQNTLVVGGLVLLLLLAVIANLITRQVIRPVRQAAEVAERFADGSLDERMTVVGEDDVARLAQAYNEMAESIQGQIEQLEDFGQLQRRFTSDVSHELRTPLTTVRMAADVLHASREQFPGGLARSTELLVDELDRFESLLGDLLEISKLDAGVEELAADPVDVRVLARRAHDAVRAIAKGNGTTIVLDMPDHEVTAELDSRRVERILRNLLANAVDHGEGLPVELTVRGDGNAVAVTVRDHGVGLRAGEAELVFNRFWRADPSRNRRTGGTGLGLSISLEDARLHGGWLDAWGERGYGAVFRLTLPCTHGHEITSSPLPLQPTDLPAHATAADADDSPEQVELTQSEITWQPAQPVGDIEPDEPATPSPSPSPEPPAASSPVPAADPPRLAWDSEKETEPAKPTWDSEKLAEQAKPAWDSEKATEPAKPMWDSEKTGEPAKPTWDSEKESEPAKPVWDSEKAGEPAKLAWDSEKETTGITWDSEKSSTGATRQSASEPSKHEEAR